MNELVEQLKKDLEDEEARYAYTDTVTNAFVSAQIKALREERGFNQEELAALIGTKQSGISRLEKSDYSAWKVETLRKLAKALGVRLRIRFEGFGTLVEEIKGFDDSNLLPKKFEDDPVFHPPLRVRRPRTKRQPRGAVNRRIQRKPPTATTEPSHVHPGRVGDWRLGRTDETNSRNNALGFVNSDPLPINKYSAGGRYAIGK